MKHYLLDAANSPREVDVSGEDGSIDPEKMWAYASLLMRQRVLRVTMLGPIRVSTMFLGAVEAEPDGQPPRVFETLVFHETGGVPSCFYPVREYRFRTTTKRKILAYHARVTQILSSEWGDPVDLSEELRRTMNEEGSYAIFIIFQARVAKSATIGARAHPRSRRTSSSPRRLPARLQEWFRTLPLEEQERLAELKLHAPLAEQFGPVRTGEEEDDERPEVMATALQMDPEAEAALGLAFGQALFWCCQARDVVAMGKRLLAVMHIWRPVLVAGLALEYERELGVDLQPRADEPARVKSAVGAVLEWARRGRTVGQLGDRLLAICYVVLPLAISGQTLAQIGRHTGVTRQAVDRRVGDFRDTFGGIKSRAMRDEENRVNCRNAQILRLEGGA